MTARKMGVAKLMVKIAPVTPNKVLMKVMRVLGTISSIPLISFEKRFIILPWGVVSKNDMGECIILTSILWWS